MEFGVHFEVTVSAQLLEAEFVQERGRSMAATNPMRRGRRE
jgi:hypothetical protein